MDNLKKSFKSLKWYEIIMIVIMVIIAAMSIYEAIVHPETSTNPLWLTIINFISAICGILCIFFTAKANISNFIFAVVNTIVYAIFLYYHKIYGTFALEVLFYMPVNFISWHIWSKHRDKVLTEKTKSKKFSRNNHYKWWNYISLYISKIRWKCCLVRCLHFKYWNHCRSFRNVSL